MAQTGRLKNIELPSWERPLRALILNLESTAVHQGLPKLPEVLLDLCLFRKARGFKFSKEPVT